MAAQNKLYDGTRAATLSGAAGVVPLAGDAVALLGLASASFADKNAGAAKPVTVAGLALGGADAGNYTLQLPAGLTADITAAPLAVVGLGALSRVYDGSTNAPLSGVAGVTPLPGDVVSLAGAASGRFADRNVGAGKAVTVAGLALAGADAANYQLVLARRPDGRCECSHAGAAGRVGAAKVYDGGTAATLAGSWAAWSRATR